MILLLDDKTHLLECDSDWGLERVLIDGMQINAYLICPISLKVSGKNWRIKAKEKDWLVSDSGIRCTCPHHAAQTTEGRALWRRNHPVKK